MTFGSASLAFIAGVLSISRPASSRPARRSRYGILERAVRPGGAGCRARVVVHRDRIVRGNDRICDRTRRRRVSLRCRDLDARHWRRLDTAAAPGPARRRERPNRQLDRSALWCAERQRVVRSVRSRTAAGSGLEFLASVRRSEPRRCWRRRDIICRRLRSPCSSSELARRYRCCCSAFCRAKRWLVGVTGSCLRVRSPRPASGFFPRLTGCPGDHRP